MVHLRSRTLTIAAGSPVPRPGARPRRGDVPRPRAEHVQQRVTYRLGIEVAVAGAERGVRVVAAARSAVRVSTNRYPRQVAPAGHRSGRPSTTPAPGGVPTATGHAVSATTPLSVPQGGPRGPSRSSQRRALVQARSSTRHSRCRGGLSWIDTQSSTRLGVNHPLRVALLHGLAPTGGG